MGGLDFLLQFLGRINPAWLAPQRGLLGLFYSG
jgi:hypothetical protein